MNKLLSTISTMSLLFAVHVQSAHAEGIGDWFKGAFSSVASTESDAEMHDETDVGHEVMEGNHGDSEAEYTPYEEESEDSKKETQDPKDITAEDTDIENDDEKEAVPVKNISPVKI